MVTCHSRIKSFNIGFTHWESFHIGFAHWEATRHIGVDCKYVDGVLHEVSALDFASVDGETPCPFCFILLINDGSHMEVYWDFLPRLTSSAGPVPKVV